jgi:hypothetical protein
MQHNLAPVIGNAPICVSLTARCFTCQPNRNKLVRGVELHQLVGLKPTRIVWCPSLDMHQILLLTRQPCHYLHLKGEILRSLFDVKRSKHKFYFQVLKAFVIVTTSFICRYNYALRITVAGVYDYYLNTQVPC